MDVIEAMETCSAARYLRPDPVPQDLIERVIYAATRASSPGNSQEWDFIVYAILKQSGKSATYLRRDSRRWEWECQRPARSLVE
jgi:nitroreductase